MVFKGSALILSSYISIFASSSDVAASILLPTLLLRLILSRLSPNHLLIEEIFEKSLVPIILSNQALSNPVLVFCVMVL